jgi:hypothetical protein
MAPHSNISPSAAGRWTACPGSVALCAKCPPSPTSIHAAEGTAAHTFGEEAIRALVKGTPTAETDASLIARIGETTMVDGFEIEITEEMCDSAFLYRDTIASTIAEIKGMGKPSPVVVEVEKRVVAKSVDSHLYGTSDVFIYQKGNILVVPDYKYGKGVAVSAEGNKQLMIYAIGAMDMINCWAFNTVRVGIVQPRANHPDGPVRWWEVSVQRLKEEAATLKAAIALTRSPNAPLLAGTHCRWCAAKAECPAIHAKAQAELMTDFGVLAPAAGDPIPAPSPTLPAVMAMSVEQMARTLEWKETVSGLFESIEMRLKAELEAGREVPGFKLVEGRSNRKWKDEALVEAEFGPLLGESLYEKKILSPAKLEKIVGKKGGKLDHLTFKPEAPMNLARSTDSRPAAVTPSSIEADFGGSNALLAQLGNEEKSQDPLDGLK